jgi:hypothetical protein
MPRSQRFDGLPHPPRPSSNLAKSRPSYPPRRRPTGRLYSSGFADRGKPSESLRAFVEWRGIPGRLLESCPTVGKVVPSVA